MNTLSTTSLDMKMRMGGMDKLVCPCAFLNNTR